MRNVTQMSGRVSLPLKIQIINGFYGLLLIDYTMHYTTDHYGSPKPSLRVLKILRQLNFHGHFGTDFLLNILCLPKYFVPTLLLVAVLSYLLFSQTKEAVSLP